MPIGNLTSQYFANLYLNPLDHFVKRNLGVKHYCRYMDDSLLFGPSKALLQEWSWEIRAFLSERLQLRLKEKALRLAPVSEGVPFLGQRVFRRLMRLQRGSKRRLLRRWRATDKAWRRGWLDEATYLRRMHGLLGYLNGRMGMLRRAYLCENENGGRP